MLTSSVRRPSGGGAEQGAEPARSFKYANECWCVCLCEAVSTKVRDVHTWISLKSSLTMDCATRSTPSNNWTPQRLVISLINSHCSRLNSYKTRLFKPSYQPHLSHANCSWFLSYCILCFILYVAFEPLPSLAPTYLTTDIHLVCEYDRRPQRSSTDRTLTVPRTHNRFGDRSFAVAGLRLWNSLPINLRQISSYGQFRRYLKYLKNHLFWIWEITAQCDTWFSALYK